MVHTKANKLSFIINKILYEIYTDIKSWYMVHKYENNKEWSKMC